jgi:biotin synthase
LDNVDDLDEFTFIKTIAIARIMMPKSHVRLSAGRDAMSEQTQALCFMAGANSIFYGCKLLTTDNPDENSDMQLFKKLGINKEAVNFSPYETEQNVDAAIIRHAEKDELFYDATAKL